MISDKDQRRTNTTRNSGWNSGWTAGDELNPPPAPERTGPSLAPFLRHRRGDRWWRVGIGFLYVPATIVVITVEHWLGISQGIMWISLGVFFVAFLAFILLSDRLRTGD